MSALCRKTRRPCLMTAFGVGLPQLLRKGQLVPVEALVSFLGAACADQGATLGRAASQQHFAEIRILTCSWICTCAA